MVTFLDFAEATTFGDDESDALLRALDALETVLAARIDDREDIPLPSAAAGRPCVILPALTAAKVLLYRAMRGAGVRKPISPGGSAGMVPRSIASRLDQIEAALAAIGKRLTVDLGDAA